MPQSRKRTAEGEPASPPPVGGTTGTAGAAGAAGAAAATAAATAATAATTAPAAAGGAAVAAVPALRPRRRLLRVPKLDIGVSPAAVAGGPATVTVNRSGAGVPGGRTRTVLEGSRREDILQCGVVAALVAKAEGRPPPQPPSAVAEGAAAPAGTGGRVGGAPTVSPSTGAATAGAGATVPTATAAAAPAVSAPRPVLMRLPLASHAAFDAFLDALADTRAAATADATADAAVGGGDAAAAAVDGSAGAARPVTPLRTPGGGVGGGAAAAAATTPAGSVRTPARPPSPPAWVRHFRGVLELSHRLGAPAVQARYVALVVAGFDGAGWASPHLDVLAADALCPHHTPWPAGVVEAVAAALRLLASRPDYRDEAAGAVGAADGSPAAGGGGESLSASVGKSVRRIWRWGGGGAAAASPPPPDVLPPVVRLLVQDELAPSTRGQLAAVDPAFGHPASAPAATGWARGGGGGASAVAGLLPGSASPLTTGGRPSPVVAAPSGGGTPLSWRRLMVRRTATVATPAMTRRALRYAPTT